MSQKVLIIAYYWPPAGGPGVQRWLKFVKYLPEFGIEPIVYVPENATYPIVDNDLLAEVPERVTVIKQPIKEPFKMASLLSRKQTKNISSGLIAKEEKQSLVQRLMLYVRGNFFIPDARIGWVRPSVNFLCDYISKNRIETVITTGPPHSMHLIGLGLKKQFPALKWLTDFRDPWTTIGYHSKLKMGAKAQQKHLALEKEVLQSADTVIVTSPTTKSDFEKITTRPVHLITNGYDDDFKETEVVQDTRFVLSHIGSLLSERNPVVLWQALKTLTETNKDFAASFVLQLVGRVSDEVVTSIKEAGLAPYLELVGYVSHQEALRLQRKASMLLLIEIDSPDTKAIIAGKVFEYMAAKKPVLAVGPAGADIKDIITISDIGTYHTYQDTSGIKDAITNCYANPSQLTTFDAVSQYHRKSLTANLAGLLK